jgi:hypothetical protein
LFLLFPAYITQICSSATWDAPPKPDDPGYPAFEKAFQQYLDSRDVHITIRNKQSGKQFDIRRKRDWVNVKLNKDPELGQQGKLMDFQVCPCLLV